MKALLVRKDGFVSVMELPKDHGRRILIVRFDGEDDRGIRLRDDHYEAVGEAGPYIVMEQR